ncbi:MAG TPA: DUF2071 domain-containing protein [Thermomicrobiaceae bacterium]|nr:DUF2071 domain-containing protein [Thermomicrobiaceae bacterium]
MSRPFLTARWTNLVLANYRAPAELLRPHVPPGSELDTPDGTPDLYLVSVVAFRFSALRVLGLPLPTAQDFPEVNLRFYVRRGGRRATVFLDEYVPTRAVVLGARLLYNQPYHLATISHRARVDADAITVETTFRRAAQRGEIRLRAANQPTTPDETSLEHFLKEHYWGFDRGRRGTSFRYRVDHPVWRTYPVEEQYVGIDPATLGDERWQGIDWGDQLHSVLFAEGSAVTVYAAEPLIGPHDPEPPAGS